MRHILSSRKIIVTEEDVASLPATNAYVDIFLMLCELPYVDPNWNKRLVLQSICFYFQVARYLVGLQLSDLEKIRLVPIVKNPHMGFGRTLKFMLKMKDMRDKTTALLVQPDSTPYTAIFTSFFTGYDDAYSWYSEDALADMLLPPNISPNYFQAHILPLLKQNTRQLRQEKKESMDPMKEELVANVYHPRNVERWLEAGGHELLDMMF